MSGKIGIEMYPGALINRACEDACRVANILGVDAEFSFNGVICLAQPGGSSAELAEIWETELRRELRFPYDRRFATTNSKSAGEYLRRHPTPGDPSL
jgi:hypothetical protein